MEQRVSIYCCGNGVISVGFVVVVLHKEVVEDAMNQPKPAPTAEEQPLELPPLDVTQEERTQIETMRPMAPRNTLLALERLACRERQLLAALRSNREKDAQLEQLKAELSQYAFIADAASMDLVSDRLHVTPKLKAQLAEKDARIGELETVLKRTVGVVNTLPSITGLSPVRDYSGLPLAVADLQDSSRDAARARNGMHTKMQTRAETAEAKLRAVSEAMKEKRDVSVDK